MQHRRMETFSAPQGLLFTQNRNFSLPRDTECFSSLRIAMVSSSRELLFISLSILPSITSPLFIIYPGLSLVLLLSWVAFYTTSALLFATPFESNGLPFLKFCLSDFVTVDLSKGLRFSPWVTGREKPCNTLVVHPWKKAHVGDCTLPPAQSWSHHAGGRRGQQRGGGRWDGTNGGWAPGRHLTKQPVSLLSARTAYPFILSFIPKTYSRKGLMSRECGVTAALPSWSRLSHCSCCLCTTSRAWWSRPSESQERQHPRREGKPQSSSYYY